MLDLLDGIFTKKILRAQLGQKNSMHTHTHPVSASLPLTMNKRTD